MTRQTEPFRTESLLGGGPPVATTTTGAVHGAGASLETALTIVKNRPSRLPVAYFP
jgi:hypothetical protein